jgi:hypothetical protein
VNLLNSGIDHVAGERHYPTIATGVSHDGIMLAMLPALLAAIVAPATCPGLSSPRSDSNAANRLIYSLRSAASL